MTAPQQPPPEAYAAASAQAAQAVGTLATFLAASTAPIPAILALLTGPAFRFDRRAAQVALELTLSQPPSTVLPVGPVTAHAIRVNRLARAQYLVNASRRLTKALRAEKPADTHKPGQSPTEPRTRRERLTKALRAERRYFRQQRRAHITREHAAAATDGMAQAHDGLVGWHAVLDERTSAECRAAHRANFYATDPPAMGLPGSVHVHCRCFPVPPWPSGRILEGSARWAKQAA